MKVKNILIFCLLLYSRDSIGQKYSESVILYYKKIYQAEAFIIESKFDSASKYYADLMKTYKHKANAVDLYNSLLVNLIIKNKKCLKNCLQLMSDKNISIQKLLEIRQIDSLIKKQPKLIKNKFVKNLDKRYKKNSFVLNTLDSAFKVDQDVRKHSAYKTAEGQKAIYYIDSINSLFLNSYLTKNGFNDYEAMLHNDSSSLSELETMLIHQATWHRTEYINLIQFGIENLEIKPGIANYILDVITGNNNQHETVALFKIAYSDSICFNEFQNKWLIYQYNKTIIAKINDSRKRDLLEDWDFYLKKCIFLNKRTLFKWHNSFSTSIMNFSSCEELKSYINNAKDHLKIID